jgi:hypothetical protein
MDNWEREFPFSEILAEAFKRTVTGGRREIEVVVEDLEEEAYC